MASDRILAIAQAYNVSPEAVDQIIKAAREEIWPEAMPDWMHAAVAPRWTFQPHAMYADMRHAYINIIGVTKMKIIHRGVDPDSTPLLGTCNHCHTKVEFLPFEAKRVADQRDGDFYKIDCPVCSREIITPV